MKFYRLASGFPTKSGSLLPTKRGRELPTLTVRIEVLRGGQLDLPKSFSVHDRTSSYNKYKKESCFFAANRKIQVP